MGNRATPRIATVDSGGNPTYLELEHLRTTKQTVNGSGTASSIATYYPYGEQGNAAINPEYQFTNQIRENNGLDHFWMRTYASNLGRWLTPDPANLAAVDPANPQSWNRYAYVLNNPMSLYDPFGLEGKGKCYDPGTGDIIDVQSEGECNQREGEWIEPLDPPGCDYGCGANHDDRQAPDKNPDKKKKTKMNDPCANSTLSATGVDIHANIAVARAYVSLGSASGGNNPLAGIAGELYSYYELVRTGGPQDVKDQPGPGTPKQRIDAGNISFGVTCPFGAGFCQFAAGLAQTLSGNPNFDGTLLTGFDTPEDNAAIRVGQAMRAAGCHE